MEKKEDEKDEKKMKEGLYLQYKQKRARKSIRKKSSVPTAKPDRQLCF